MMEILGILVRLILFGVMWMMAILGIGIVLGITVGVAVRAYHWVKGE